LGTGHVVVEVLNSEVLPEAITVNLELPLGGAIAARLSSKYFHDVHTFSKVDLEIKFVGFTTLPDIGLVLFDNLTIHHHNSTETEVVGKSEEVLGVALADRKLNSVVVPYVFVHT
jgi:hypothetical protein